MADDVIRKSGSPTLYSNDRGNAKLITEPVIGIVKNNIDPTHSGRIDVYVANYGGSDPDDSANWIKGVKYLSPWFGIISPNYDATKGPDADGYGRYVGNPHSYGFWASAPDLGTEVVCIFIDGKPNQGYYVGCVPQIGLHHMVPAVGAATHVVPNEEEAKTYGGADRLPVTEVNYTNPAIRNSPTIYSEAKPVHSYQASVLAQQGLIRDNVRGVISSSSQRETPSKVFGFSTPGNPIYRGGFTDQTVKQALDSDPSKLQIDGRRGGHSFVMDDGTIDGQDQLVRLRTSAGHMIMMNDSGQSLFLIHANGQSWVELGKEGTIDMYSTNSVNIRTKGDLNLHADRDINMHAKRNFNLFADNIKTEAEKSTTMRSGNNFESYTLGKFTVKVDGPMSHYSSADASYASGAVTYINGKLIKLNSGFSSTVPAKVNEMTKIQHTETVYTTEKVWMYPGPDPLLSITTRLTTHQPYIGSGKGVDFNVNEVVSGNLPVPPQAVQSANQAAGATPANPVNPAVVAAVPPAPAVKTGGQTVLDGQTTAAVMAQNAANSAALPEKQQLAAGLLPSSPVGATVTQMANAGGASGLKLGADALINQRLAAGQSPEQAMTVNTFTKFQGISSFNDMKNNVAAQTAAVASNLQNATDTLVKQKVITGTESPTQVAGVINATANFGISAVKNYLSNPSTVGGKIAAAFTAGNFASGLADKIKSGIGGIVTSVGNVASKLVSGAAGLVGSVISGVAGLFGGATKTIGSLVSQLQSGTRKAFSIAMASFGNLKAGKPNVLGGASGPSVANDDKNTALLQNMDNASAVTAVAESNLDDAKKAYRSNSSPENLAALKAAEAVLTQAKQRESQASKSLFNQSTSVQNVGGEQTSTLVATTENSGVNALPGGIGALAGQTFSRKASLVATFKLIGERISTTVGNVKDFAQKLKNPQQMAGNLINNFTAAVNGVAASYVQDIKNQFGPAYDKIVGISEKVAGIMKSPGSVLANMKSTVGGLGSGSGVKPAQLATDTYNTAPIVAKTGQLLGDPKVPPPVFTEVPVKIQPDAYLESQTELLKKIKTTQDEIAFEERKIDQEVDNYLRTNSDAAQKAIEQGRKNLDVLEARLRKEQDAYETLIKTTGYPSI